MHHPMDDAPIPLEKAEKSNPQSARNSFKSRQTKLIAVSALLLTLAINSAAASPARAHAAASLAKTQADVIEATRAGWTATAAEAAGLQHDSLVEQLRGGAFPAEATGSSTAASNRMIAEVYKPWGAALESEVNSGKLTPQQAEAQKNALLSAARGLVTGEWS